MDLKIIVTYDISVNNDTDLDDLAQEIEFENYLDIPSICDIGQIDSVFIAKSKYKIKADDMFSVGKINNSLD